MGDRGSSSVPAISVLGLARACAPGMDTHEQVIAAVRALYHAPDLAQKAQANQWLTSFQHSEEAWQVPFGLLTPAQPDEVQFFAATLLVRKVKSEWSKLDAGNRQGLNQAIRWAAAAAAAADVLCRLSPGLSSCGLLCIAMACLHSNATGSTRRGSR